MKPIKSRPTRALPTRAIVKVADNSGAKELQIIAVKQYRGVKRRQPSARVGDIVVGVVKSGKPEIKHTMVYAVIVRQKQPIRRPSGERIRFEDNAAVILKDSATLEPKGTMVKGPIAKEVVERYPKIGKISTIVV